MASKMAKAAQPRRTEEEEKDLKHPEKGDVK
jgi:hypothetical protein